MNIVNMNFKYHQLQLQVTYYISQLPSNSLYKNVMSIVYTTVFSKHVKNV